MLIPAGWADVLRSRFQERLHFVLRQRGVHLLQQPNNACRNWSGCRSPAIAVEESRKVRHRTKIRLVRVERSGTLTAVTDELFVLVDSADCHHSWMTVRAPNALTWTCVGPAAAVRTRGAAVPGGKQDEYALVQGLDNFAREGVI